MFDLGQAYLTKYWIDVCTIPAAAVAGIFAFDGKLRPDGVLHSRLEGTHDLRFSPGRRDMHIMNVMTKQESDGQTFRPLSEA